MLTHDRRRPAFTLIELLVVISIIAVLVALTATAAMGVRRNMQKQNAETTLQKLDTKLRQKMKDNEERITDDLRKGGQDNAEVSTILAFCGGNKDLAKGVMMYARMRRDLPMTFAEARNNFTVCGYLYRASPTFSGLPATGPASIEESAACLYAALGTTGMEGLEQQVGNVDIGGVQHKVFVDGFGSPIGFNRLGYDGNGNELNTPPHAVGVYDPFYPNKTGAAYRNLSTDFPGGAAAFTAQVWNQVRQPAVGWLPAPGAYPGLKNHTAYCFSAGINKVFAEPPSNTIYDGDNLFSYRLRKEGGKGD